jgi:diguanylate cyclase (GGDEF)-like protein/PAS domain S-box-containing protein
MVKFVLKNSFVRVLALFFFPAITIIGFAVFFYMSETSNRLLEVSMHEKALVTTGKVSIERSLDGVKNDLKFLSNYHEFRNVVNEHRNHLKSDFINDFYLLMNDRRVYDQIRWIDESGMEKLRLDYLKGHSVLQSANKLQTKKERYYFNDSVDLPEGSIYVSPFDLNVDHGSIEIPYKPVIRIATPMVDIHGHRRGIFIINYLGSDLIRRFEHNTATSYGLPMLLNHKGYFLKGVSRKDEWGFMFNRSDLSLAYRYPEAWKRISREKEGQFEDAHGLWTFTTIYTTADTSTQCSLTQNCGWKAITFVPADILYANLHKQVKIIVIGTFFGLVLAGAASFGLVYLYRRQRETLNDFRELQKKTEGILLSVPDIIMQVDSEKHYIWANTQGLEFFGADVIGQEASHYFEGAQDTYENIHPMLMGDMDAIYVESWQRRCDGEKRLLAWWCQNIKDDDGSIIGALSTARDITEERQARDQIDKLSKVLAQIADIVSITDKFGKITYVNAAYCLQSGYTREELIGNNSNILQSGMHDDAFYRELWTTILNGNVYRNTIMNRKKNGDLYFEKKTISPLKDKRGTIVGFVSTGKDVTEEEMLHQEIERIATIDQLTGIFNRHKFEELFALEGERSRRFSQPLSLILIDIDHFKTVNDTYGHDVGDKVLVQLADIVRENIRKIDIFARWGGEEFLILCPGTDVTNVQGLAEKLRTAVEESSFSEIGKVTISLGLSSFNPEDSFSELFKRADQGLYYAKEHGRNQVVALS